jgi:iron(III) transport system substrate-binding protein
MKFTIGGREKMLRRQAAVSVLLLTLGVAPSVAEQTSKFQQLLEAAKKERELVLWSNTPDEDELPPIVAAFNKRFGLNIKVNQVPMGTRDFTPRVLAGLQAGHVEVDIGQGSSDTVLILTQKGALENFDWVGTFGRDFPAIKRRVDRVIPEFRGKVLDYWHLAYCIGFRPDRVKQAELPRTWEGLADPKWRGQVVVNQAGSPFHYFAPFWGPEKVLELVRKLKANQPVFAKGSPGVSAAIESGQATLGAPTIGQAVLGKEKGAPVDWLLPSEIPIEIEHLIIPKKVPHPNLARLWAAWITTEGQPLFEKLTKNGLAWAEDDSFLSRRLKQNGTKYNFIETTEQNRIMDKTLKQIAEIYLGK